MILWSPETKEVKAVEHPGHPQEYAHLSHSDGACWEIWRMASKMEQLAMLYRVALKLSIYDDIPTEHIVDEFKKIPEFSSHWALDSMDEFLISIQK